MSKYKNNELLSRPNWHKTFKKLVETWAERSTCLRLKTAAILVRENRSISVGYNGVNSKKEHCSDYWFKFWKEKFTDDFQTFDNFIKSDLFYDLHHKRSVYNEIHAEMNALLYAAKEGIKTNDTILYTLYSPCIHCAKSILAAGIIKVYYIKKYDRLSVNKGIEYLKENNVVCEKI